MSIEKYQRARDEFSFRDNDTEVEDEEDEEDEDGKSLIDEIR